MASVILDRRLESSSTDEPMEHDDYVDDTKVAVICRPTSASLHDQMTKTREVFEDLKNAAILSITGFKNNIAY